MKLRMRLTSSFLFHTRSMIFRGWFKRAHLSRWLCFELIREWLRQHHYQQSYRHLFGLHCNWRECLLFWRESLRLRPRTILMKAINLTLFNRICNWLRHLSRNQLLVRHWSLTARLVLFYWVIYIHSLSFVRAMKI